MLEPTAKAPFDHPGPVSFREGHDRWLLGLSWLGESAQSVTAAALRARPGRCAASKSIHSAF
jgi:hypothetical protein